MILYSTMFVVKCEVQKYFDMLLKEIRTSTQLGVANGKIRDAESLV